MFHRVRRAAGSWGSGAKRPEGVGELYSSAELRLKRNDLRAMKNRAAEKISFIFKCLRCSCASLLLRMVFLARCLHYQWRACRECPG